MNTIRFYKVTAAEYKNLIAANGIRPYALYFLDNGELYRGTTKIAGGSVLSGTVDSLSSTTPTIIGGDTSIEGDICVAEISGYNAVFVKKADSWQRVDEAQKLDELEKKIDNATSELSASLSSVTWDKVYLDEDFTFAGNYTLGNKKTSTGTAYKVNCLKDDESRKSVKEMMTEMFMQRLSATIKTNPSVNLTLTNQTQSLEVGSDPGAVTFSASLNAGEYTYGPATGVTASSWSITNAASGDASKSSGSVNTGFGIATTTQQSITVTATATYGDGVLAKDNTGSTQDGVKIAAGSKSASKTATLTGFKYTFYTAVASALAAGDITSSVVRTWSNKIASNVPTTFNNVPTGTQQILIAVPQSLSKKPTEASHGAANLPDTIAFLTSVKVAGADKDVNNNAVASMYDIWAITYGDVLPSTENYKFTWANK